MGNIGKPRRRIEVLPEHAPAPAGPPATQPAPAPPVPDTTPAPAEPARTGQLPGIR